MPAPFAPLFEHNHAGVAQNLPNKTYYHKTIPKTLVRPQPCFGKSKTKIVFI